MGETAPPKVLIWWKSGQNLAEPSKTPWKSEQKWRPTCFDLKVMAPELTWRAFYSFGGQVFFGQVWEHPGKILSHPQTFLCSYTYVLTQRTEAAVLSDSCKCNVRVKCVWNEWPVIAQSSFEKSGIGCKVELEINVCVDLAITNYRTIVTGIL